MYPIEVSKVGFSYQNNVIFKDLNLKIVPNKITAIIGPSGCGKTTLLKLISSQLFPSEGEVLIEGKNTRKSKLSEIYQLRKKMGMLFQSGALLNDLTVFENVALTLKEHTDLSENMIRSLVLMKLQVVGLRGVSAYFPHQLSGGMLRRAALARALALDPSIIFYDEPFAGQDPVTMGALMQLIKVFNQNMHLTSVIVSHDIKEVFEIADFVCVLSDKKVLEYGKAEEVKNSKSDWVRQFVTGKSKGPIQFHQPSEKDYQKELTEK